MFGGHVRSGVSGSPTCPPLAALCGRAAHIPKPVLGSRSLHLRHGLSWSPWAITGFEGDSFVVPQRWVGLIRGLPTPRNVSF